jgi:tRNA (guanine-N7-)-methyltransferase
MKGNRIWRGARTVQDDQMDNAGFLRTQVERIDNFFISAEVSEIWITFPDPQPQKTRERKRLTCPGFLDKYRKILRPEGIVHLKTDSAFLFEYSLEVIEEQKLEVLRMSRNIDEDFPGDELLKIRTFYEMKFRETGVPINYVSFRL